MNQQEQRPIDNAAKESYSWFSKTYVMIAKTKIKTWQSIFILAFITGVAATLIWSVSIGWHSSSSAASLIPDNQCIAIPAGGEFGVSTNVQIRCGRKVESAFYKWDNNQAVRITKKINLSLYADIVYDAASEKVLTVFGSAKAERRLPGVKFNNIYNFKPKNIATSTMTISASPHNSGDVVAGTVNVPLAGGKINAGSSAINITELSFHGSNDNSATGTLDLFDDNYFDKTNISLVKLLINGEPFISQYGQNLVNGEVIFNFASSSPLLTIPAGGSIVYQVIVNVANNLDIANKQINLQLTGVKGQGVNKNIINGVDTNGNIISVSNRLDYGRMITLRDVGRLTISMDSTIDGVNRDKYILAGTQGNKIARIKMRAEFEDIKLTKIYIQNDDSNADVSVNLFHITDSEGNVLSSENAVPGPVYSVSPMSNENGLFTIPVGTNYYYVTLDTRAIGQGVLDTAKSGDYFKILLSNIQAIGAGSGAEISSSSLILSKDISNNSIVTGVKIAAISDLSSTISLATGEQKIFQFMINTVGANNMNSITGDILKTEINSIKINIGYNLSTLATSTPIKLFREGKPGYLTAYLPSPNQEAIFNFNSPSNNSGWVNANSEIDSNASAVFYVKAMVNSADTNDFVKCSLSALDNGSIIWNDQEGGNLSSLLLGISKLEGDLID